MPEFRLALSIKLTNCVKCRQQYRLSVLVFFCACVSLGYRYSHLCPSAFSASFPSSISLQTNILFFVGRSGRPSLYRKEKSLALLVHRSYHRLFRGDRDSRNIFSLSLFSANDRPISQKRNSLLHQTERGAAARHVHPIQDNTHTRGYFSRPKRRRRAARTRVTVLACLFVSPHSVVSTWGLTQ